MEFFNEKNRETTERGGRVKIPWHGPIETVEYIWRIFGGCLIGFCHETTNSAKIKRLLCLAGMKCVKILTYCKA